MPGWLAKLRSRGLVGQMAVLIVAVLGTYALVTPVALFFSSATGLAAAALGAALCLAGAVCALVVCRWLHDPRKEWKAALAAMLPRMGIPLGFALFLQIRGGALVEAGLLYYLVVFYTVTLALETAMTLPGGAAGSAPHATNDTPS